MSHRVVVTGMSGVTALGNTYDSIEKNLRAHKNAVVKMADWDRFHGMNTRLAAPIENFKVPETYTRKQIRSMGRIAKLATVATEQALTQSGLLGNEILTNGETGVAYGSSTGSTPPVVSFINLFNEGTTRGVTANSYIQMMSHTAAVNVGLFFGLRGRIIPTSSACTSGSQAIGYAYESIKFGRQTAMVAGGGEELCPTESAVFDTLFATSVKNDQPESTPSPYDKDRDGLVIGEGAGTFVLENMDHAVARGAKIYAEIVGFKTNCDAAHVTRPDAEVIQKVIEGSLKDAKLSPQDIGYISGHATATKLGDIAETQATYKVFGDSTPISSMKGNFGHTLGACGAIESWLAIEMMNNGWFAPTMNLNDPDPDCAPLDFIKESGRDIDCDYVMNNNFGFGGINTSLIFKKWHA